MLSVTRAQLSTLTLIIVGVLTLAFPLLTHANEDGYRLLELDGYKVKWGDRGIGVGASISYAFAGTTLRFDDARNCRDLAPIETLVGGNLTMAILARETAAAFQVWERAAGLSFHEVSNPRDADIIFGVQGQPSGQAFTNVSYTPDPEEGVHTIEQALVCLNPEHRWKVGFDGDEDVYDIRYTLIHEIGHAIGLDHPGRSGQVMAFRYTEAYDDLQPGDLRGARLLYGPAADDSRSVNGLVTQLAHEPTESKKSVPISDLIIYRDGSIDDALLSPNVNRSTQSRDRVNLAIGAE